MPIRLQTLPSSDAAFASFARACLEAIPEASRRAEDGPAELQRAIRDRYPAAIVTPQSELARHGDGPLVWYAFRSGAAERLPDPAAEVSEPSPAWAVLDDERRFVEVSEGLAQIAEVPGAAMVGQPVEAFTNPDDPTIREDIERLWGAFRRDGVLASTMRFNYADGRPRELAYRIEANAAGRGRHFLAVRDLPAGESSG